jgi:parvulin-like peptidyl-prolyl isomerase
VQQAGQSALQRKAWEIYYEENVKDKVDISEDEIRDIYETQRYRYHIGWIFVRSRALAEELAARISAGEDFGELASKHSVDASRMREGDIGVRALGTLPRSVENMVLNMSPGEVSAPIEYSGHYILAKLYSREDAEPPDYETMRQSLIAMLRTRKETAIQTDLAEDLKEKYGVTFRDEVVDMVAAKARALHVDESVVGEIPEFSDEELSRVLAEYGGKEWRVRALVERIQAQPDFMRPGYGSDAETIRTIVGSFITGELWMLEIQDRGYTERPEVVRMAERAREQALVTMMHQQVVKDVEIDDAKLREFYEENKADLMSEASVELAVITTETEDEAKAIHQELLAGADFAATAKEKSFDEMSGSAGGELRGPLYQRQLEAFPEIDELVQTLDVGKYSEPVPVPAGFMPGEYVIVKVLNKTPSEQLDFEEVESMIGQRVVQLEQDKAFGGWLAEKMDEYGVEIYPDPLNQINFEDLRAQE